MRRGIRSVPLRRRIFVACEGESEQGYGALLQRIADDQQTPHIFLDLQLIGGGDPLSVVEGAQRREREQSLRYGQFELRAIFLDYDRLGQQPARDARIAAIAAAGNFLLVWQRPCFEGFLLRHLPGCQALRPPTSQLALTAVTQRWPDYRKPMPGARLAMRIAHSEICAATTVEADLKAFLNSINFL